MDSIESGKGILKDYYDSPLSVALRNKREKLADTKGIGKDKEEEKEL